MILSEKIFFFLEGKWTLNRSTNGFGDMTGLATFSLISKRNSTLLYREDGIFTTLHQEKLLFYKEYIYCLHQGVIEVYFSSLQKKQNLLHTLTFSQNSDDCSAIGTHHCKHDLYKAIYTFVDMNTFTLRYDVQGPQKKLIIETHFTRQKS